MIILSFSILPLFSEYKDIQFFRFTFYLYQLTTFAMKFRMSTLKPIRSIKANILEQDQKQQEFISSHDRNFLGQRPAQDKNNMNELISLLKNFVQLNTQKKNSFPNPRRNYEVEPRDRQVLIDPPELTNAKMSTSQLKLWVSDVFRTVCSSAFNYLSKNEMSFDQAKIYCSQNILKNIVTLSQKYHLNQEEMELIDSHIKKGVLNYLSAKYPLTDSAQINKKLEAVVKEVDNIESLQNNYFTNSKIVFEYRESGNYNDLIMMMINDLIGSIDSLTKEEQTTNYQEFQEFMSDIFEKVTDLDWIKKADKINLDLQQSYHPIDTERFNSGANFNIDKTINQSGKRKVEDKDQYRTKVKEYTNYVIGRKTSENTPLYTSREIQNGNISIKSPQILRILSKWCQELFQKYNNNYFSNRSQSVKVQRGENVNSLLAWMRKFFDRKLEVQKNLINKSMGKLFKNNYQMQANILESELERHGQEHLSFLEKVCGKFSFKIVKNLHAYIIIYLNKLIHGLLKASKAFIEQNELLNDSIWPTPPNLLSFKISDLMRCKFSSKQKEVLRIYEQINQISRQFPQKLKIVRIKNRLRMGTNDILMNIRFNDRILCQIQLAIITKNSDFIKCSNSFQHYLYELQRSLFGPLTELCSIWNSLDRRSNIYQQLVEQQQNKQQKEHQCASLNRFYQMKTYEKPFICSRCKHIYCHNLFPKQHTICSTCSYLLCAKCSIEEQTQQSLKKILGKDQLVRYCGKKIRKEEDLPKFGICTLIEAKVSKVELFTWITYRNCNYLLGKKGNQFYEIYNVKTEKEKEKFRKNHLIFQLLPNQIYKPISQKQAINKYIIPSLMKKSFQKEKESLNLMDLGLNTDQCRQILSIGTRPQKQMVKNMFLVDNNIEYLPFHPSQFPNIQWITLSRNQILKSIKGIEELKYLNNLIMSSCYLKEIPNVVYECKSMQQLSFSTNYIQKIDDRIANLQSLKFLQMSFNRLSKLPQALLSCKELKTLNFQKNYLQELPENIYKLQNLEALSLTSNKLKSLPESIGQLKKLKKIYLDQNKDIKQLPKNFQKLKEIEYFDVSQTLIEHIPISEQGWPNLKHFSIGKTKIKSVPSGFKSSKNIELFAANSLDGFSFEDVTLDKVKNLDLHKIDFKEIKKPLIGLKHLKIVNLSHNSLSNIQLFFQNLQLLQNINLSNCKLTDIANFSECHNLKIINISSNMIRQIPSQYLEGLRFLEQFLCYKNLLSSLPLSFTKMTSLKSLDVSHNEFVSLFEGDFQQTIQINQCFWPNLKQAFLISNKFYQISLSLCYSPNLIQLNILNNQLKRIRPQIKDMANLNKFNANNNMISEIPREFFGLSNLQVVYLQNNQIVNILDCMRNMSKVTFFSVHGCPIERVEPYDWVLSRQKQVRFSQNMRIVSAKMKYLNQSKKI